MTNADQVKRLALVFDELILRLENDSDDKNKSQQMVNLLVKRIKQDGFQFAEGRFTSNKLSNSLISMSHLVALTEASIAEHVEKARWKIESDPAGAITNAYTLVEDLLKFLLRKADVKYKENEGNIRDLYAALSASLNLSPKGETLESYLKSILQGLLSQVSGLYELANKASDRHARKYNPQKHHAQLAVNAAFTLCEFLLASFDYQHNRPAQKKTDLQ